MLEENNCAANASVLSSLSDEIQSSNPLRFLSRAGCLGTEHKRQSFYIKNFTVVRPVEYVLNAQEKTFICVCSYFRFVKLLERSEILQMLQRSNEQEGHYRSFQDGEYFKQNKLLSEELSIALGLYVDDFEICNPLGTSKKKHKVCGIYWVIVNLTIRIYLAALCKTVHIKQYGYCKVLVPLIRDLQHSLVSKALFCLCQQTTWVPTLLQDIKSLSVLRNFVDFVWPALRIFSSMMSELEHLF